LKTSAHGVTGNVCFSVEQALDLTAPRAQADVVDEDCSERACFFLAAGPQQCFEIREVDLGAQHTVGPPRTVRLQRAVGIVGASRSERGDRFIVGGEFRRKR
jgi:hypothetical protein